MSRLATIVKHDDYLQITLTADGHEEIADILARTDLDADARLGMVLEYELGNGWEMLRHGIEPDEVGGLTEAPMLSDDTGHDDRTNAFTHIGRIYWFPDYQVIDPVVKLAEDGYVRFPLGEDMSAQFTELAQMRRVISSLASLASSYDRRRWQMNWLEVLEDTRAIAERALRIETQFGPYDPYGEKLEVR